MEPDEEVVAACRKLREQGYQIALDDFVLRDGWEPMLGVANVLKIEIRSLPEGEHEALVSSCHARGLKMLAEKVETYEEFAWARKTGYDYFQGFFFARPADCPREVGPKWSNPIASACCVKQCVRT